MSEPQAQRLTPATSTGEVEQVMAHVASVMDALLSAIEEETALVRAGRVSEAAKLEPAKTELARQYIADTERLKASKAYMAKAQPTAVNALRDKHDTFRTLLQTNLTVLATAHAVSESIIRGVSGELARKAAPSTYGATGRANTLPMSASQPLAVCRTL